MTLQRYAALAQQLDVVRRDEAERAAGRRQEAESNTAALHELVDRLTEQQAALQDAAHLLRIRMPLIDPPPSNALTAREALSLAQAAADAADANSEYALRRAEQPRWLPDWSPLARNAAIYAGCAGVGLMFQAILILLADRVDTVTAALWSLCGLPVIAFFVGYLLIGFAGIPRISPPSPGRDVEEVQPTRRQPAGRQPAGRQPAGRQRGERLRDERQPPGRQLAAIPERHPKLGATICFLTLPVCWLALTLLSQVLS